MTERVSVPESNDLRYSIAAGVGKEKLWVAHESGEGGNFPRRQVILAVKENRLHDYYKENF